MDAKPQRPRILKVHDENMPPPNIVNGKAAPLGKTLHQRTKSTPALSSLLQVGAIKAANRKVLGEANANLKVVRDDSELGKASPGKMNSQMQEMAKPVTAALARPAARPMATKTSSAQSISTAAVTANLTAIPPAVAVPEPARKTVTPKKSAKVLKDIRPSVESATANLAAPSAAVYQPLQATKQVLLQTDKPAVSTQGTVHHEVRKTESVPLRDESHAPRPLSKPVNTGSSRIFQAGYMPEPECYVLASQDNSQTQHPQPLPSIQTIHDAAQYPMVEPPLVEQYYDCEEEEYYCEEGYTTARSFNLRGESTGGVTTILAPRLTDKIQTELDAAKAYVEATRSPDDVEDEQWDTSMVAEYGDEIFAYMRDLETKMAPNPRYMEQQTEIQWSMRAVLMDWVIQVHQRFNLLPETLFLTVNYIDRFLSCKIVSLGKLQLVGATAIFVAAKYEEVQCPTIAEIIYMVDGGYTADELLKAERFMLSMLQFELGWPGPMSFLRRISKADDYDLETRTLAKYFLEVTIMDERFVGCTPSFLAAGAHCMARMMLRKGEWTPAHVYYSNYTYGQLRQLLTAILECCEDPQKHHSAVFEKYMDKRYKRASTFVAGEMQKGFTLPGYIRGGSMGPYDSIGNRLWS